MNTDSALFAQRIEAVMQWIAIRRTGLQRYGLIVALLIFAFGLFWSLDRVGNIWSDINYRLLVILLFIGAPVGMVLNSLELYAISRIAGAPIAWVKSLEITVYTSAANMLPVPGAGLARIIAMKSYGVSYAKGSAMLALTYAIWGGLAFLYAAAALSILGKIGISFLFATVGLALLAITGVAFARFAAWRLIAVVALLRLASFPLEALRYMIAISAVGATLSFAAASVLVVTSFIGSAVMFAPSGLGVGEAVVVILSPLIEVEPGKAFLGAAIGRVIWMMGLLLSAGGITLFALRKNRA